MLLGEDISILRLHQEQMRLDRIIPLGERHFRRAVSEFVALPPRAQSPMPQNRLIDAAPSLRTPTAAPPIAYLLEVATRSKHSPKAVLFPVDFAAASSAVTTS